MVWDCYPLVKKTSPKLSSGKQHISLCGLNFYFITWFVHVVQAVMFGPNFEYSQIACLAFMREVLPTHDLILHHAFGANRFGEL